MILIVGGPSSCLCNPHRIPQTKRNSLYKTHRILFSTQHAIREQKIPYFEYTGQFTVQNGWPERWRNKMLDAIIKILSPEGGDFFNEKRFQTVLREIGFESEFNNQNRRYIFLALLNARMLCELFITANPLHASKIKECIQAVAEIVRQCKELISRNPRQMPTESVYLNKLLKRIEDISHELLDAARCYFRIFTQSNEAFAMYNINAMIRDFNTTLSPEETVSFGELSPQLEANPWLVCFTLYKLRMGQTEGTYSLIRCNLELPDTVAKRRRARNNVEELIARVRERLADPTQWKYLTSIVRKVLFLGQPNKE